MLKNTGNVRKGFWMSMMTFNDSTATRLQMSNFSTLCISWFHLKLSHGGMWQFPYPTVYAFFVLSTNMLQVSCGHIFMVSCQTLEIQYVSDELCPQHIKTCSISSKLQVFCNVATLTGHVHALFHWRNVKVLQGGAIIISYNGLGSFNKKVLDY